jgi:AraC-like DNA-binding protein
VLDRIAADGALSQGVQHVTTRNEGPFGCWTSTHLRPPHLAGLVDQIWYSEGTTTFAGERIFPNGKVEIAVVLSEPYRLVEGAGPRLLTATVSGLQSHPLVIEGPSRHRVLGIRLRAAGAYAVLARPMAELSDLTVELCDVLGREARELADRCHDARSPEACLGIAAAWVSARVARTRGVDPAIAAVAAEIERARGDVSIAWLRERTGVSRARFAATFREQIGLAPKLYARIARFHRVLATLQQGGGTLADVALDAGYYDQPHMNADFRELAGVSPSEFIAARYPSGDGSTAAEMLSRDAALEDERVARSA